jgi:signal transduction histidine kinase
VIRNLDPSLAVGTELAELCRTHEIGAEWIAGSQTLDDLLARVLDDCDRRVGELPQPVFESDGDPAEGHTDPSDLRRLRVLIAFARQAADLRERTAEAPALVSGVADLERIKHRDRAIPQEDVERGKNRAVELMSEVASLCHKINNPLTSLLGRAQMLQLSPDPQPEQLAKNVVVIEDSARRVAALVQELGHLICRGKEELLSK